MQITFIQNPGNDVRSGSDDVNNLDLDELERLIDVKYSTQRKAGSQHMNSNVY